MQEQKIEADGTICHIYLRELVGTKDSHDRDAATGKPDMKAVKATIDFAMKFGRVQYGLASSVQHASRTER